MAPSEAKPETFQFPREVAQGTTKTNSYGAWKVSFNSPEKWLRGIRGVRTVRHGMSVSIPPRSGSGEYRKRAIKLWVEKFQSPREVAQGNTWLAGEESALNGSIPPRSGSGEYVLPQSCIASVSFNTPEKWLRGIRSGRR